jgi:helix-turn-helix resolvase-like protein
MRWSGFWFEGQPAIGEGRSHAEAHGVSMGRKPKLTQHQQHEAIRRRDRDGETLRSIARTYNVDASIGTE